MLFVQKTLGSLPINVVKWSLGMVDLRRFGAVSKTASSPVMVYVVGRLSERNMF